MIQALKALREISSMFADGKVTRAEAHELVDIIYDLRGK
jgi:hypothetical protein